MPKSKTRKLQAAHSQFMRFHHREYNYAIASLMIRADEIRSGK